MKRSGIVLSISLAALAASISAAIYFFTLHSTIDAGALDGSAKATLASAEVDYHEVQSEAKFKSDEDRKSRFYLEGNAFLLKMDIPEMEGEATAYIDDRLARSKRGEGQASYEIFTRISSCRRALDPGDSEEYKAYASVGLGGKFSERVEREIELCKGLNSRDDINSENWLALAAEQGSIEARLMYARNPREVVGDLSNALKNPEEIINYRAKVVRYLQESVSAGSVDSMEALANIYDRGILAEKSPEQSLAYWLAYDNLNRNELSATAINRISADLSPDQSQAAREMAGKILNSCCK
ncbi:hypothetical protein [Stenotrophomonas riyadhensis]